MATLGLAILILATLVTVATACSFDFYLYDTCAQSCIQTALSLVSCQPTCFNGLPTAGGNHCLCSSLTWLDSVAKCTYTDCGLNILESTANTAYDACSTSDTPMVMSVQEFIDTGKSGSSVPAATPTATPAAPATTPSSTDSSTSPTTTSPSPAVGNNPNSGTSNRNNNDNSNNGWSSGAIVALVVSVIIGLPAFIVASIQLAHLCAPDCVTWNPWRAFRRRISHRSHLNPPFDNQGMKLPQWPGRYDYP